MPLMERSSSLSSFIVLLSVFSLLQLYLPYHSVSALIVLAFALKKPHGFIRRSSSSCLRAYIVSGLRFSPIYADVFSTFSHAVFCTSTAWNITVYGSSDHQRGSPYIDRSSEYSFEAFSIGIQGRMCCHVLL